MTATAANIVSQLGARFALLFAVAAMSSQLAAQEVQGPPDGFLPPARTRPAQQPAQGPDNGGIPPIATPQPRPQSQQPSASVTAPAQIAPQPTRVRPSAATPAAPRALAPDRVSRPPTSVAQTEPLAESGPALPAPGAQTIADAAADTVNDAAPLPPAPVLEARRNATWLSDWWPWAIAMLVALVAAVWWLRRDHRAPALVDGETETADAPMLERVPAPATVAPPAKRPPAPTSAPPAPTPAHSPAAPAPVPASGRARLAMTLMIDAIDMLADSARISFSLLLANQGDRIASGGLVRIALQQANRRQSELLERFFDGAGGSVLAEDVEIAPGDVGTIQRHALLALDQVEPMLVAGYPSLIPVIGFDVTYHWDGEGEAFGQVASAFVLGSAAAADGRIAPVRLDLPPRRLTAPSARVTEMQRVI